MEEADFISLHLETPFPKAVLALGGEQKGRFCLARGDNILISPDFGDLKYIDNLRPYRTALEKTIREEKFTPRIVAHDLHPGYSTTRLARDLSVTLRPSPVQRPVQHHHAHLASVMAERARNDPVIGIIWDGTGYGEDGAVWGGEFMIGGIRAFRRAAHLEYVPLPGGDKAIEEPWRMAVAYLHHYWKKDFPRRRLPFVNRLNREEIPILISMIERGINSPLTSSMGRLFDAVSALLGLAWKNNQPAEAAIALEKAAGNGKEKSYPFKLDRGKKPYIIQLEPVLSGVLEDIKNKTPREIVAARFHNTVIVIGAEVAGRLAGETGRREVILSGGVFRNRIVRDGLAAALEAGGLKPILPERIPVDDGNIALGQAVVARGAN
ncbi:MAG: hypothetical protein RAO92_10200 [Candidatus Euphemobacter frigidus]|nr:hypothetical protein [Candidatus Euphemobacter frigidus]MDP8276755.1 hypothetical protein [Candidatus Euphemobacter frigidus]